MTDQTKPPLCIQCDHKMHEFCHRPAGTSFDLINGEHSYVNGRLCENERRRTSMLDRFFGRTRCGPLGLYFAPKRAPIPPFGGSGASASSASPREKKNRRK